MDQSASYVSWTAKFALLANINVLFGSGSEGDAFLYNTMGQIWFIHPVIRSFVGPPPPDSDSLQPLASSFLPPDSSIQPLASSLCPLASSSLHPAFCFQCLASSF